MGEEKEEKTRGRHRDLLKCDELPTHESKNETDREGRMVPQEEEEGKG